VRQRTPADKHLTQIKPSISMKVEIAGAASGAKLPCARGKAGRDKHRGRIGDAVGRIAAQFVERGGNVTEFPTGADFARKQFLMAENTNMRQHIDFPLRSRPAQVDVEQLY